MARRLTVSLRAKRAMEVTRVSIHGKKLVYVIQAQKPWKYREGRSRVVYIGTTRKGVTRIAQSAAAKAKQVLELHGVRAFEVRILACAPRRNVKTWLKLERALLAVFRKEYGAPPKCNTVGKRVKWRDDIEGKYFKRSRLVNILASLA
ncbi:MAG: hypothetical protein NTX40_07225 [Planctomycetota bacterium]|nr:hypothetical protein [Planctomycetota bacterium]